MGGGEGRIEDGVAVDDETPWLSLTFSGRPTVTGVYVYDAK